MELNTRQALIVILVTLSSTILADKSLSLTSVKPKTSKPTLNSNKTTHGYTNYAENTSIDNFLLSTTIDPFEMCDGNNTCNSTDLLNATESELSPKNLSEKFSIVRNFIATEQFCTCDLQVRLILILTNVF